MKVLVSVVGRFHAFDLAKQLQNNNLLYKLNTTYPKYLVKKWGILNENVNSNFYLEIIYRLASKFVSKTRLKKINIFRSIKHSKSNIKLLKNTDLFIGWSGSSLETLISAKKEKKITILERGSSHYNYQMSILKEEYASSKVVFDIDFKTWERELLEYQLADYISIPSNYVKRTFIQNGISEKKLIVNPYGVNIKEFKNIPKKDTVFRVINVGAFSIRKGSRYILEAFYDLNLPNSEFVHVGTVKDEVSGFVNKYKRDNIKYLGQQPQQELFKHYSQASVFVLMSLEEGLAMVQPQAMACGLPIICSENTGGEDLLTKDGEEGFVVKIRDVDALKEKLLYLYQNQDICKSMGNKAKKRVQQGFSWDDYGTRYSNNLVNILEENVENTI